MVVKPCPAVIPGHVSLLCKRISHVTCVRANDTGAGCNSTHSAVHSLCPTSCCESPKVRQKRMPAVLLWNTPTTQPTQKHTMQQQDANSYPTAASHGSISRTNSDTETTALLSHLPSPPHNVMSQKAPVKTCCDVAAAVTKARPAAVACSNPPTSLTMQPHVARIHCHWPLCVSNVAHCSYTAVCSAMKQLFPSHTQNLQITSQAHASCACMLLQMHGCTHHH